MEASADFKNESSLKNIHIDVWFSIHSKNLLSVQMNSLSEFPVGYVNRNQTKMEDLIYNLVNENWKRREEKFS